jgi:DNA-binding transcriptional MerR regulator
VTYRTPAAARELGVGPKQIRRLADAGLLPHHWSSGTPGRGARIFTADDLAEFRRRSAGAGEDRERDERRVLK